MINNKINRNLLSLLLIVLIVSFGIFKTQILAFFNSIISHDTSMLKDVSNGIKSFYNSGKDAEEWMVIYTLYYPIYLSFHFLLIFILFQNQKYLRKVLMVSLASLLGLLIIGKFIFGYFNVKFMAEYFSFAFHKLVALPFILLVIEGGRQIWLIVQQSEDKHL